jgi:hypothetical protein
MLGVELLVLQGLSVFAKAEFQAKGVEQVGRICYIRMSSAKLQVRPILLKKISFMIFFNNYAGDYGTIHYR